MKYKKVLTPEGFDDFLELEFAYKYDVELKLHNVFSSYGYSRIRSAMLEYIEVFDNKGSMDLKNTFKFIDKDGEVLALKPDITPSIARIVANNYSEIEVPYRLAYIDNTFAQKRNDQGKARELTQAGVELIGVNNIKSDAEIIILAINSILETGLSNFKIEIGNVKFLQGILLDLNLEVQDIKIIERLIVRGNFAEVTDYVNKLNISKEFKEFFSNLFALSGSVEVIEKARKFAKNDTSIEALDRLIEIHKFIEDANYSEFVNYDLSMIGHFDYYTGIIFHGYTNFVGSSILDGGRYDNLIGNFGVDLPAIGFAIRVNELVDGLFKQNVIEFNKSTHTLVSFDDEARAIALQTINRLRTDGLVFEYSLFDDIDKTKKYAKDNGFGGILYFKKDETISVININNDTAQEMPLKELVGGLDDEK